MLVRPRTAEPRPRSRDQLEKETISYSARSPSAEEFSFTRPSTAFTSHSSTPVLLEATGNRKKAENDLQILVNRIALLRLEEERSAAKITETKLRGMEILHVKKRNEEIDSYRRKLQRDKEKILEEWNRKAAKARLDHRQKMKETQESILSQRRAIVFMTKEQEKKIEQTVEKLRLVAEAEKRLKAEEERQRREIRRRKKEEERLERELKIHEEFQQKVEIENKRRQEAEELLRNLEREEKDILIRLKRTQQLQEQAYEFLQKSLDA